MDAREHIDAAANVVFGDMNKARKRLMKAQEVFHKASLEFDMALKELESATEEFNRQSTIVALHVRGAHGLLSDGEGNDISRI